MRLTRLLILLRCLLSPRCGRSLFERVYHFLLCAARDHSRRSLAGKSPWVGSAEFVTQAASNDPPPVETGSYDLGGLPPRQLGQRAFDLFRSGTPPQQMSAPPLLVFLHGGAWVASDKRDPFGVHAAFARALSSSGVSVANANYRLAALQDGVGFEEQIADVLMLLKTLLRDDVAGCRQSGIVLSGHSAGATLALQAALRVVCEGSEHAAVFQAVRGVYAISGVYDLIDFRQRCGFFVRHLALSRAFPRDAQRLREHSPWQRSKDSLPFPVRLVHGDGDGFLLTQAQEFVLRMQAGLNRASLRVVSQRDHFTILDVVRDDVMVEDYLAFQADCELVVGRAQTAGSSGVSS